MPARLAFVLVALVGCGHTTAVGRPQARAPERAAPVEVALAAPVEAEAKAGGATAQVITFDGEDAEPEPATMVRSPPPRPKIPSFELFGTRSSDGPR